MTTLLVLWGGPRRGGNTETLTAAALKGASEAGAEVVHVRPSQARISPCLGCRRCDETGTCVVSDGMSEVYPWLEQVERVLISSPIYFYGVSGWAKAVIDRCQPFWARKHLLGRPAGDPGRWGAFIAVGATSGKRLFEGAVLTVKYCYRDLGVKYAGSVLVRGVENPGDIDRFPEHLEAARQLGHRLITRPEDVGEYEV